jgi:putative tryptophan/tyrosine transport system substrate-binding protein
MPRSVLVLLAALAALPAFASRVVVVASDDLTPYTAPIQPFLDALGEPAEVYNLRGREADAQALSKRLAARPPDVVFALGAKAAWILRKNHPKIPVVYASILAPARFDIEGRGTVGIAMVAAPELAVSQFKSFFSDIGKIGVLRGPSIPDSRIAAMEKAAKDLGIELVIERVRSPAEVRQALHKLGSRVDAIWLQADRAVVDRPTYRFVVEETQRTRRPLVVETENMVRAGGMFATIPDSQGLGRQAAAVVREVLDDGRVLKGELLDPDEVDVVLNLGVLRAVGAPFDMLLIDFVDVVVE